MNINATLFGQMLTFALLIWFTIKWIWPPVIKVLREREQKIAAGLEAAERGEQSLQFAKRQAADIVHHAKVDAVNVMDRAHLKGIKLVEEARTYGRTESHRLILQAQEAIEHDVQRTKIVLREQLADLIVAGAEKVLAKQMDRTTHQQLLNKLIEQL